LGCLRRNRRRVFAAAVTRYLKSVYAAVAADIGTSLVSRQPGDRPRKVTRELAAKRPVPVLSPPGTLPAIRGRQVADGKPIRRAGPPAARAPEAARQQRRSGTWERYGERRTVRGQGRAASSPYSYAGSGLAPGRCGGDMSTPQKYPPTRHYLPTTSDNRRSVRPRDPQRLPAEVRRLGPSGTHQLSSRAPRTTGRAC
jgi:hypothetical protein